MKYTAKYKLHLFKIRLTNMANIIKSATKAYSQLHMYHTHQGLSWELVFITRNRSESTPPVDRSKEDSSQSVRHD